MHMQMLQLFVLVNHGYLAALLIAGLFRAAAQLRLVHWACASSHNAACPSKAPN
jgi:hypothetical protein